jgi:hypothetical protein
VAVTSPFLEGAPRYGRTMHGWVDVPDDDQGLVITVRLADPWVGIELGARTSPSPEYGIREAWGRVQVGPEARVDPTLGRAMAGLAGLTMTAGLTRRVAELIGDRAGAAYVVDAAIEIARLARQVTRLPREVVERHRVAGAAGYWRLDLLGWLDLAGSCYTYRPESESLFAERAVVPSAFPELYAPPRGGRGVFTRTKAAEIEIRDDWLHLGHTMFDDVHSFQVWYRVDRETGVVIEAGSLTPRLPYAGLCTDVQARVRDLRGQRLDAALRKRLGGLVGGPAGCAQLYDLTADLLRLLTLPG